MYSHGLSCNRHSMRYRLCMKHLTLLILLALAPLSWGKVRLVCTSTIENQTFEPSHKTESDDPITVVLRNIRRPYSAKIVGGRSLPVEISDDKERYVGKEGSSDQGDYISLSIHRQTLEISYSSRLGYTEDSFTGQCEVVKVPSLSLNSYFLKYKI